ncbi:MAG: hypothetical protein ABIO70_24050 [Pseudomonadota bacterium]
MDRESIAALGLALVAFAPGCTRDDDTEPHFDGPVAAAVLQPEQGGPFDDPVGFVSNSRSGRITALDLEHGRLLSDSPSASFLRAPYVACGRDRILGDIAVFAPDAEHVTLFVADLAGDTLVEAPYVLGLDPYPVFHEPEASEPAFVDADASGDSVTVSDLLLRRGYTTTEEWVLEYDGEAWTATGSRSGRQEQQAVFGEAYHSGYREIELTLSGTATAGDRVEFSTDTGVVDHDMGGAVQGMALRPDQGALALAVFDRDSGESALEIFDPATSALLGALPLEAGAQPWRMVWTPAGDRLYVADASLPVAWEITWDDADPLASAVRALPMHAPLTDLAFIDTDAGERLAVAPVGANRVDLYDLAGGAFLVVNPYLGEDVGLDLGSPVTGLAAAPFPVELPQTTEWGARVLEPVVAVSLFSGRMVFLQAATGCLAQDQEGPVSLEDSTDEFDFQDLGEASTPYLWADEATGLHVAVNACAGIAAAEEWQVVYDEVDQSWWVKGADSGEQASRAYNDARYVSDEGAISFTVMSGVAPATDGDTWYLRIDDGVLTASGNLDQSGDVEYAFELPGRPVCFWYRSGRTGGGWDEVDERAFALWPITNSDYVGRVRITTGNVEIVWN